jgi:hypothetical protein
MFHYHHRMSRAEYATYLVELSSWKDTTQQEQKRVVLSMGFSPFLFRHLCAQRGNFHCSVRSEISRLLQVVRRLYTA